MTIFGRARRPRSERDGGSASIWMLAFAALVLVVGMVGTARALGVLARHRAESAADLASLAAAGQIGMGTDICSAAAAIAAANHASVLSCRSSLASDGRSGAVTVRLTVRVQLPLVGAEQVTASARAGRDAVPP